MLCAEYFYFALLALSCFPIIIKISRKCWMVKNYLNFMCKLHCCVSGRWLRTVSSSSIDDRWRGRGTRRRVPVRGAQLPRRRRRRRDPAGGGIGAAPSHGRPSRRPPHCCAASAAGGGCSRRGRRSDGGTVSPDHVRRRCQRRRRNHQLSSGRRRRTVRSVTRRHKNELESKDFVGRCCKQKSCYVILCKLAWIS